MQQQSRKETLLNNTTHMMPFIAHIWLLEHTHASISSPVHAHGTTSASADAPCGLCCSQVQGVNEGAAHHDVFVWVSG